MGSQLSPNQSGNSCTDLIADTDIMRENQAKMTRGIELAKTYPNQVSCELVHHQQQRSAQLNAAVSRAEGSSGSKKSCLAVKNPTHVQLSILHRQIALSLFHRCLTYLLFSRYESERMQQNGRVKLGIMCKTSVVDELNDSWYRTYY